MPRSSAVLLCLLLVASAVPTAATADLVPTVLAPPVDGEVVARFDAPTTYGPGHRGVDLRARPGTSVRAPTAGRVTFAGTVVGARWVTVEHGALRSTVGPLATVAVGAGDRVAGGGVLGTSGRAHGLDAVHWSVRRGDTYLDPLGVLALPRVATLLPRTVAVGPHLAGSGVDAGGAWRGRVR